MVPGINYYDPTDGDVPSTGSTTQGVINDFLLGLNGSAQYSVNGTYDAGPNTAATPPGYSFIPPPGNPG